MVRESPPEILLDFAVILQLGRIATKLTIEVTFIMLHYLVDLRFVQPILDPLVFCQTS